MLPPEEPDRIFDAARGLKCADHWEYPKMKAKSLNLQIGERARFQVALAKDVTQGANEDHSSG